MTPDGDESGLEPPPVVGREGLGEIKLTEKSTDSEEPVGRAAVGTVAM